MMPDREKVIEGLDICINTIRTSCPSGCPYYEQCTKCGIDNVFKPILRDALALLKEQEAVEPKKENDGNPEPCTSWWYVCGDCGRYIDPHDKFCRHCGREVDWCGSDA